MKPVLAALSIVSRDGMVFLHMGPMIVGMPPEAAMDMAVMLVEKATAAHEEQLAAGDHREGGHVAPEEGCDD